jgi:hypothetical protein
MSLAFNAFRGSTYTIARRSSTALASLANVGDRCKPASMSRFTRFSADRTTPARRTAKSKRSPRADGADNRQSCARGGRVAFDDRPSATFEREPANRSLDDRNGRREARQ